VLNKYFERYEKALSKDFCNYIIKSIAWDKTEAAKVNRQEHEIDLTARITNIYWEKLLSPIGCVVQSYIVEANKIWNYDIPINSNWSGVNLALLSFLISINRLSPAYPTKRSGHPCFIDAKETTVAPNSRNVLTISLWLVSILAYVIDFPLK